MAKGPLIGGFVVGLVLGAVGGIAMGRASAPPGPVDPSTTATPTPASTTAATTATTATPPATAVTAPPPATATSTATPPTGPATATATPAGPGGEVETPAKPEKDDPAKGLRIVKGIVVAEDAAPIPFAWVTGEVDYRPVVEVQAGRDGKFTIAVPGTMPITLRARARYASDTRTPEANAAPGKFATLVLQVRDGGTLAGGVIDSGGDPIEGAAVVVEWKEPDDSEGLPEVDPDGAPLAWTWKSTTNAAGGFRVAGCRPWTGGGYFLISATHPNYHPAQAVVQVEDSFRLPEPFSATITMREASVGKARYVEADGSPIAAGAIMIIVRDGNRVVEWTRAEVKDGEFTVRTSMPGTLVFVPIRDRLAGVPTVVEPPEDGSPIKEVVVTWKPAPPLCAGQLLPPPGVGLFEAKFHLTITSSGTSAGGPDIPVTYDEETGKFSLPRQFYGVEGDAAYAVLTVQLPGCKPKQVDFNCYDDETAELDGIELEEE
jgi:hypothetical protein